MATLLPRSSGLPPLALIFGLAVSACADPPAESSSDDDPVSSFVLDAVATVSVLENVPACEVDAACYLRLQFADTAVIALYGTGERPAPPCRMTTEVSDVAFRVLEEEMIEVRQIRRRTS